MSLINNKVVTSSWPLIFAPIPLLLCCLFCALFNQALPATVNNDEPWSLFISSPGFWRDMSMASLISPCISLSNNGSGLMGEARNHASLHLVRVEGTVLEVVSGPCVWVYCIHCVNHPESLHFVYVQEGQTAILLHLHSELYCWRCSRKALMCLISIMQQVLLKSHYSRRG